MSEKIQPKENSDFKKINRKKIILIVVGVVVVLAAIAVLLYLFVFSKKPAEAPVVENTFGETDADGEAAPGFESPLSGLPTTEEISKRRPIAVMLGNDPVARPLSGLSKAEIVVEMPVLINDITRLMPIYQINDPKELGGVRSARHNFITLANGYGAMMVHWGGSFRALSYFQLNYIDHVDGLTDGSAFYRVARKAAPYNGYTDFEKARTRAAEKGYGTEASFRGYTFVDDAAEEERPASGELAIPYPGNDQVTFKYNKTDNKYIRYNNGELQKDEIDGSEITAKNIVVMRTTYGSLLGSQYLDVKVEGEGECTVYQNGESIPCTWKKDGGDMKSPLVFVGKDGKEVPFVRGATWIEIVKPDYGVTWDRVE